MQRGSEGGPSDEVEARQGAQHELEGATQHGRQTEEQAKHAKQALVSQHGRQIEGHAKQPVVSQLGDVCEYGDSQYDTVAQQTHHATEGTNQVTRQTKDALKQPKADTGRQVHALSRSMWHLCKMLCI